MKNVSHCFCQAAVNSIADCPIDWNYIKQVTMTSDRRNCIFSNPWTDDDDHSLHDDDDHRPHDDDDLHRLHSGTMCFPGKIGTSMGIKENNIFGLISQTFQFMAKYIFSAIHLKNNPFCLKILGQSELSEDGRKNLKFGFKTTFLYIIVSL